MNGNAIEPGLVDGVRGMAAMISFRARNNFTVQEERILCARDKADVVLSWTDGIQPEALRRLQVGTSNSMNASGAADALALSIQGFSIMIF